MTELEVCHAMIELEVCHSMTEAYHAMIEPEAYHAMAEPRQKLQRLPSDVTHASNMKFKKKKNAQIVLYAGMNQNP